MPPASAQSSIFTSPTLRSWEKRGKVMATTGEHRAVVARDSPDSEWRLVFYEDVELEPGDD